MIITYEVKNSLYINITNQCSNRCYFCVRDKQNHPFGDLHLEREPSLEEIKEDIDERDLSRYDEVVFCGYGEPFCRYKVLVDVAKYIKSKSVLKIRVNTNGQANLINDDDITPDLEGVIDALSVSLNAPTPDRYDEICHSRYGMQAFEAVLDFTSRSTKFVPDVTMTVVDGVITPDEISLCEALSKFVGAKFRVRRYVD